MKKFSVKNWIFGKLGYTPTAAFDALFNCLKLADEVNKREIAYFKGEIENEKVRTNGARLELAQLRDQLQRLNFNADKLHNSRFLMITECGGHHTVNKVTEDTISRYVDEQDCHGEPLPAFLYLDADGKLYPVTFGKPQRINTDEESPFYYAESAMIANGSIVGTVLHTDH